MNWKGRTISGILDGIAAAGLHGVSRRMARLFGVDPEMVGRTWRGAALSTQEIAEAVRSGGSARVDFLDAETPLAWCFGRKQPEARG